MEFESGNTIYSKFETSMLTRFQLNYVTYCGILRCKVFALENLPAAQPLG